MKILLTGASGYIGQAFMREYCHAYSIRAMGRRPVSGDVTFISGDIRSFSDVAQAAMGSDIIVHLAACTPDTKEKMTNEQLFDCNVRGTFNVLQAALVANVKKVVYASSICAVGYEGLTLPVQEDAIPNPSDGMYGFSKYIAEELCKSYAKVHGLSVLCLRLATVVPQHEVVVPRDPDAKHWYGYVDIRDVVHAIDRAVCVEGVGHGVFHICAENAVMKYNIAEAKRVLGFNPVHNYRGLALRNDTVSAALVVATPADKKSHASIAIEGRVLHRNITGTERYISELIKNVPNSDPDSGHQYFLVNNTAYDSLGIPKIPYVSSDSKMQLYHRTYQIENFDQLSEFLSAEKTVFSFLDLILCKYPQYFTTRHDYEDFTALMGLALHASTRIISLSEHAKQDAIRTFNIPAEKIDVVYLGIDQKKFKKVTAMQQLIDFRSACRLPEKYILYIGTDYPHKNIKNLLIAFAKIADEQAMQGYGLVLAGTSYHTKSGNDLERYMKPIKDKIVSLGYLDDAKIPLLYNAADMLVFPSLYEGFGLPVLEAFACETPVICSRAASLPEVAGDAACMVDATDPGQIADAIIAVATDQVLRATLVARGRERARKFTWEQCAQNTYKVYAKALREDQDSTSQYAISLRCFLKKILEKQSENITHIPAATIMPSGHEKTMMLAQLFFNSVKKNGLMTSARTACRYLLKKGIV